MDKKEFLVILRQSLNGEISSEKIEQNIEYYNSYISSQTAEEEIKVTNELGDPRLIAKTIIEAERATKLKGQYSGYQSRYSTDYTDEDSEEMSQHPNSGRTNLFYSNIKWYHKLMIILGFLLIFIMIIAVGRIIIGFLFAFGVPVILLLLLLYLFKKR